MLALVCIARAKCEMLHRVCALVRVPQGVPLRVGVGGSAQQMYAGGRRKKIRSTKLYVLRYRTFLQSLFSLNHL